MHRLRPGLQRGLSLIVTLVVTAGVAIAVGSVLCLTSTRSTLTRRVSQYDRSVAAAVAATQKVHAQIALDFQRGGDAQVANNISIYRGMVPTTAEVLSALQSLTSTAASVWQDDQFLDEGGQLNQTSVERRSDWAFRQLQTRLTGLRGYAADYLIVASSRKRDGSYDIAPTVKQEIQVASIPIFQYQLFYVPDMEIHPSGSGMTVSGRVHANGSIYCRPEGTVTFLNHVTTARDFINARHLSDPVTPGSGYAHFQAERVTRVNTLNIPMGIAGTPTNLRALIEAPPLGELPGSAVGQQRFYNKADLIVYVSNGVVIARSGIYNASAVPVPWIESRGIVSTGKKLFYDKRETKDLSTTEIDIAAFLANYNDLTLLLGRPVKIIWAADLRSSSQGIFYGIRVVNGRTLPAAGLTIATPNPLYIHGHYNVPLANLGTTNTAGVHPACLAADSVTILSGAWFDGNGPKSLAYRPAEDTTVNAAIITGIVPTGSGNYSGGVENALRTLENWSGRTLTFNGALGILFYSSRADAPWGGPDVYSPPVRKFNYDWNLGNVAMLPPGTPEVRTIFHSDWTVVARSAP